MKFKQISRRRLLELGAAASVGVVVNTIDQPSSDASSDSYEPVRLSGLAAEYDRYDGLGLAALVAKRQVAPLELLNAVKQRFEAINPRLNATAQVFFDKAEAQINQDRYRRCMTERGYTSGPAK